MNLPTKFGLGTLTLGTVTGVSSGIGVYLGSVEDTKNKGKSISELIEEKYDYILLEKDTEDLETKWKAVWDKYEKVNTTRPKGQDELKLTSWPLRDQSKLIPELKRKCQELSKNNNKALSDDLYKKVTNYCSREVNLEEQARKENLKIADTGAGKDMLVWNARSGSVSYLGVEFKKLGLSTTSVGSQQIREVCENSKKKSKHDKFLYAAYKKICIKLDSDK